MHCLTLMLEQPDEIRTSANKETYATVGLLENSWMSIQ